MSSAVTFEVKRGKQTSVAVPDLALLQENA